MILFHQLYMMPDTFGSLNSTCLQRNVFHVAMSSQIGSFGLHGFCDASEHVYAAVVYLRMTEPHGNVEVTLVTSKTKVTPIKKLTTIMELIPPEKWNYVSGLDNPADYASRGLFPSELLNHKLWWDRPWWLKQLLLIGPNRCLYNQITYLKKIERSPCLLV